ncbi:unnamed protein product [Mytilus coruscus]|uniref:Uncharacterized protein n=1 Tax=Mytilus coruscus TaxID=42192 RepID=A0A6J8EXP3_MYTCO|nr:unnamed protein product [Mytilus coruscus]
MSYNTADGPVGATWTYQAKAWTEDVLGIEWFTNIFLKKCGNQRPRTSNTGRSPFTRAFETAFKPENIIAGFRSCEIFPWSPLNIPSAAFAPASAFDTNKPDTNEHPLQWVIRRSFKTESRVEEVTVNVFDVPGSPEDPNFMHTLSADVLLPIVDSETREAIESLISLDSGFSEVIYEVDSVIQPVAETLSTPCSSTTIDWNASVNAIFSVDPPPQKKARINKTSVTGHRILTSQI